jgi:serine/threonine protein phosphatase PrpC
MMAPLRAHFLSDVGLQRERNEDYGAVLLDGGSEHGAILAIADGMGGIGSGDVASKIAVTTAVEALRNQEGSVLDAMRHALEEANRAVCDEKERDPVRGPMGTTCTLAVIRDDQVHLAHVGDTRAYLVSRDSVKQLTRDHSLVAGLVERNQMTPEEAKVDPRRNIVTRGLGIEPSVVVDTFTLEESLTESDTLVLCTDGLHTQISDAELGKLARSRNLESAADALIRLANSRGGPDNISVILARFQSSHADARETQVVDGRGGSGEKSRTNVNGPVGALGKSRVRAAVGWKLLVAVLLLAASCALLWALLKGLRESVAGHPASSAVSSSFLGRFA